MSLFPELETPPEVELPSPVLVRWQPLRSGLLNLYRYDYQEFWFEQGRMLLRGDNGTGKSRVLALQLPFLFDAEVVPHRLEPDGDAAKRMSWNLLMNEHDDRCGYTWIELGRLDPEQGETYLTLGCGLRAVRGRSRVDRWFFITPQRVGRDLFLQTPAGQPLTRERLGQLLRDGGRLFTSASEYRTAVDSELFQLGEERYAALMDLLIQLRQPQLSRRLDEARLSQALSQALPRMSSAILADLAESFRSLEAEREALTSFQEARRGLEQFLKRYRLYARIAARRKAAAVRSTHSDYERTLRRVREAEARLEELAGTLDRLEQSRTDLKVELEAARSRIETLRESPEMRDAQRLDQARAEARDSTSATAAARETLESARQRLERLAEALERARKTEAEALKRWETRTEEVRGLAPRAGLVAVFEDPSQAEEKSAACDREAAQRGRAVKRVRELEAGVEKARIRLGRSRALHDQAGARLEAAHAELREAHQQLDRAREALLAALPGWMSSLSELALELSIEELEDWCREPAGADPLALALRRARDAAGDRLAAERQAHLQQEREAGARQDLLIAERDRLQAGVHQPPQPPRTRDPAFREGRTGAPLWLCCDFAEGLEEAERAGLEAALESSGLLDAWVEPDGRLVDVQGDALLVADDEPLADNLSRLLVPCPGQVPEETVRAVLTRIGLGAGKAWVDTAGRWRLGPLRGAWQKPRAEHVGQASREAARRRRLEELEGELAAVRAELAELARTAQQLDRRQETLEKEVEACPGTEPVLAAHQRIESADQAVAFARRQVSAAEQQVAEARQELEAREAERDQEARDLGIFAWLQDLDGLTEALQDYRRALGPVPSAARELLAAREGVSRAAGYLEDGRREHDQREAELGRCRAREAALVERRDTLEATVGKAVEQVLTELEGSRARERQLVDRLEGVGRQIEQARIEEAVAHERISTLSESLAQNEERRSAAGAELVRFAATRLLPVGELPHHDLDGASPTRLVEVSRELENLLADTDSDDASWDKAQKRIHAQVEALKDQLHDYRPVSSMEGDVLVVTVPFRDRQPTVAELRQMLSEEIGQRQLLLSAREREVLENHLMGEVSSHLHDLLHGAERLVSEMTREIEDRPTSTGMKLRLRWLPKVDGPPGLKEARALLLRSAGTWSPSERQALGEFLQRQIETARAEDETAVWQDHLQRAFDYRNWHEFQIERFQADTWKRLTRRTHGTGSGGEKAIALTLPQFAAAAAHYRSSPLAPRLILLDEAFVGVDKKMRRNCAGLLAAFDLDLVMTSEREWGCYDTLPGLAIYHLSTRPGIDAVAATRWVWNGRSRVRTPDHAAPARPDEA